MMAVLLVGAIASAVPAVARLIWQLSWLAFCARLLRQAGGDEKLQKVAPCILGGLMEKSRTSRSTGGPSARSGEEPGRAR
ncbi:hypothetical protein [Actinoplanes sp. NPDC026619]|uniref:hypothetical protein n=1 Tax=Actinoplanes sp. NPDC026619 TaxID=3155798 RepID=UPI0033DFA319